MSIGPLTGTAQVTAVMLTGGSAYGLAAADGAMRWLEERGRGYPTPGGLVPIVPAAVVYDLAEGDPSARPGADAGYAACEAARAGIPGARAGRRRHRGGGREDPRSRAVDADGRGIRGGAVGTGGDGCGGRGGERVRRRDRRRWQRCWRASVADGDEPQAPTAATIAAMGEPPDWTGMAERNTTLVCVMTDAALDKPACTRVARMASAGVARAVDPVFSDVDGDVAFCVASGEPVAPADRFAAIAIGTIAAHGDRRRRSATRRG